MSVRPVVTTLPWLVVIAVVFSGGGAQAYKPKGWYMGGGWGIATYNHDGAFDSDGSRLDDRDSSTQIYGGYRFIPYFAVEGRFSDLGDYGLDDTEVGSVSFEFSSWSIHALGIYPFGQSGFDVYGHLGVGTLFREIKAEVGDDSESKGLLSLGAAVRYTPPKVPTVTFALGYDWYTFDQEGELSDDPFEQGFKVTKINLQYNF